MYGNNSPYILYYSTIWRQNMDGIEFTPASLIDLLSKIDELKDYDINVTETIDDQLQLSIGDSIYLIDNEDATPVQVSEDVVEAVEDINIEAYENLDESIDVLVGDEQPVESGILKEVAKSLLLGGMIRLSKKLL